MKCIKGSSKRVLSPTVYIDWLTFFSFYIRDGMIKRPGNEDYLGKMMEEERQAYLKVLEVAPVQSVGAGNVCDDPMEYDDTGTESDDGLTLSIKPHED